MLHAMTAVRDRGHLHDIALSRDDFASVVRLLGLAASLHLAALPAAATPAWLIATPDETARAGAPILLDIVKPATQVDWPDTIRLKMVREGGTLEVELAAVDPVSSRDARRTYRGVLPADVSGLVRVDLAEAESNRLALVVTATDPIEQMSAPRDGDATPVTRSSATDSMSYAMDEPALSANEPMYFVVGSGATARFQLSFKYRQEKTQCEK